MTTKLRVSWSQTEHACLFCGAIRFRWPCEIRSDAGRYCSCSCAKKDRPLKSLEERFWSKVQKTDTCWYWKPALKLLARGPQPREIGGRITAGGRRADKRPLLVCSRASWKMHYGNIPEGLFVCHTCDVGYCVNPDHLFLGTAQNNSDDMKSKGRSKGGRYEGSRLSPESLKSFRVKRGWSPEKKQKPHIKRIFPVNVTSSDFAED